ncbi:MAG: XdhC family protein [Gammaproteobacteria bacterium]|nr:XdhC family protein [Gammaproteobacteria bacterium]
MHLRHLIPLFDRARERSEPLVLATVVDTAGSTYTKRGAQMLFTRDERYSGMLSGGCLEADLAGHARSVAATGEPRRIRYDQTAPDAELLGLGSGCEGTMDILLQRLDPAGRWEPLAGMLEAFRARRAESVLLVVQSRDPTLPLGSGRFASTGAGFGAGADDDARVARALRAAPAPAPGAGAQLHRDVVPGVDALSLPVDPPAQILLLGAGPDARPVAELLAFLDWDVTVTDHRAQYAQREFFARAYEVRTTEVPAIAQYLAARRADVTAAPFDAAVVMSHHLESDREYLRALAATGIPYLGLLGPAARRDKILAGLGDDARRVTGRLHAPIGLAIGATTPEGIALSIVAEIHACLGRGSPHPREASGR